MCQYGDSSTSSSRGDDGSSSNRGSGRINTIVVIHFTVVVGIVKVNIVNS
jgi:hypothetical protein